MTLPVGSASLHLNPPARQAYETSRSILRLIGHPEQFVKRPKIATHDLIDNVSSLLTASTPLRSHVGIVPLEVTNRCVPEHVLNDILERLKVA